MKIHKATKKDLKDIAKLMKEVLAVKPFNEKESMNAILKSLEFYFKIGEIYVAVGERNLVGVVVFKIEQYWEGKVILIEDLIVKKEFQEIGVGKGLINFVENYAKKNKIKSVSLTTHKKSRGVKFAKKHGYKIEKHNLFMRKEISK